MAQFLETSNIGFESVSKKDDVTVTIHATGSKSHTVWLLIKGYTERTKLVKPLQQTSDSDDHISMDDPSDEGLPKGNTSPHPVVLRPQQIHEAQSIFSEKSCSSQHSSDSDTAEFVKGSPYFLQYLARDIQKVSKKIADTHGHHCYMKIEIGHDSKAFNKQKLCERIQQACQYAAQYAKQLVVYYTGHGQKYTGNWILHPQAPMSFNTDNDDDIDEADEKENRQKIEQYPNSYISVDEVFKAMACAFSTESMTKARIIADCCYSHLWVMRIDDFRKDLIENESNSTLHLLAAGVQQVENGLVRDGKFAKFLVEETRKGSCFHAKCDKDASWMACWVEGKMTEIRRNSMLSLFAHEEGIDGGVDSVITQDSSTADESGDTQEDTETLLNDADVVAVTQKVKMMTVHVKQLQNNEIAAAQQQLTITATWQQ